MAALTEAAGSIPAIVGSIVVVIVWALTGPVMKFSSTWQLIINTGTTILTFNMVFAVQNTQNRDARAVHAKLDAILDAVQDVTDRDLVGAEEQTLARIKDIQQGVREHLDEATT